MNEYVKFFTEKVIELISNISWPISILIIFAIIKKPLFNLLTRIRKFKYADFEAEMAPITESLSKFTEKDKKSSKKQQYDELLFDNPNFAILYYWLQFETVLREKYNKTYNNTGKHVPVRDMVNCFVEEEKLPRQFLHFIYRLNGIRNYAAHGEENFTVLEAQEFINNVNIIKSYIENNL